MARPKFVIRQGDYVVGMWYEAKTGRLVIGGPIACDRLAREILEEAAIRATETDCSNLDVPIWMSGGRRFRRSMPYTRYEFDALVFFLQKSKTKGKEDMGVTVIPVRSFRRLCG